jgi:glycine dehydrogenase subunit 1
MVTAATIYMSLLGFDGLAAVARRSHANTRRLVEGLCAIDGVKRLYDGPFFHEVALQLDRPVGPLLARLAKEDILGGFDLTEFTGRDALLVCVTETKSTDDIDGFVAAFADVMA